MRFLRGLNGAGLSFIGTILTLLIVTGDYIQIGTKRIYYYTTAINPGDATSAPAGAYAITVNTTGRGMLFVSDGTYWQDFREVFVHTTIATITTTGAVSAYVPAPCTGKLVSGKVSFTESQAANDTNYSTYGLSNLSNSATAMLAASNANTTKATGGAALVANTPRSLTPHGTAANLLVTQGDRLQFTSTASGTLTGTLTNGLITLVFARTV